MIDTGVAFRYARALYELARERGLSGEAVRDMAALERIFAEIPEARGFCLRERDNRKSEWDFLEIALLPYVGGLTGETLKAAVRNGRVGILPFLAGAYAAVRERYEDTMRVLLETAREPEADAVEDVRAAMARRTGKSVDMETAVVPSLLGGLRISWDSRLIDLSAASRLKRMRAWIKTA